MLAGGGSMRGKEEDQARMFEAGEGCFTGLGCEMRFDRRSRSSGSRLV